MSSLLNSTDLTSIIQELRTRLLAIQLTDVRITPIGHRLVVDARFHDSLTIGKVRRCCAELSNEASIPISVTCMLC